MRPDSDVREVYELCRERGWAYCAGRGRLAASGVLLWRSSEGWEGTAGLLGPYGERSGGCGCEGYCRTIVMVMGPAVYGVTV